MLEWAVRGQLLRLPMYFVLRFMLQFFSPKIRFWKEMWSLPLGLQGSDGPFGVHDESFFVILFFIFEVREDVYTDLALATPSFALYS